MKKHNGWIDGPCKKAIGDGRKDGMQEAIPFVIVIAVICIFFVCCIIK